MFSIADIMRAIGRYLYTPTELSDGEFTFLLTDKYGRLLTHEFVPETAYAQQLVPVVNTATLISSTLFPAGTVETDSITIRAHTTNVNPVYVGFNTLPLLPINGYILSPGETVSMSVKNADNVYIYTTNAGDGVSMIAIPSE